VHSTNEVDAPRNATVHIQNRAPGPPNAMAVATPAMLPVPTRPASDIVSAWKLEMPEGDVSPLNISRIISGTWRTCTNRDRMEKYTPAARHR